MKSFKDITELLPIYLDKLFKQKEFRFADLTEGKLKDYFSSNGPVSGVFVMFEEGEPVYVGRSKTLAQRIGVDLRSIQKSQATLTHKLINLGYLDLRTMEEARSYMFNHFTIKMLQLEDEYDRVIFQIYAAMELNTKFNSFLES
ncbi:MAG: hypothetical protein AAGU75_13845 [Bacillota bacterium]|uniref:hypothetical protein n=1 Tax=Desulfitobacterium hafniense TaxID=49338 RepID=UPI00037B5177|nr:hypothetical protein [Desulfitobacterium hafniense]